MKGKWIIFIIGFLFVVTSYAVEWKTTGWPGKSIALDDQRVTATLEVVAAAPRSRITPEIGNVKRAWLSNDDRGYRVNLIIDGYGWPWYASTVFSSTAAPIEHNLVPLGGVPRGFRGIGVTLLSLWLVFGHLVPLICRERCPYCPGAVRRPVYIDIEEISVYPGGTDDDGYPLPPIVRRDYVCPQCGYRRVTYRCLSPSPTPAYGPFASSAPPFGRSIRPLALSDDWLMTMKKQAAFHTFEEWKAYYNELKALEREERSQK